MKTLSADLFTFGAIVALLISIGLACMDKAIGTTPYTLEAANPVAYSVGATNVTANWAEFVMHEPTVVWEWDEVREHNKQYLQKDAEADEFNRTNTDQRRFAIKQSKWFIQPIEPQRMPTTKELGYRSDGVVVWRDWPESKH